MPILGLALLLAAPALAADVTLQGRITDPTGTPIAGLLFAQDEQSGAITSAVASVRNGRFQLSVPPRRHRIGIVSNLLRILVHDKGPAGQLPLVATAAPYALDPTVERALPSAPVVSVGS